MIIRLNKTNYVGPPDDEGDDADDRRISMLRVGGLDDDASSTVPGASTGLLMRMRNDIDPGGGTSPAFSGGAGVGSASPIATTAAAGATAPGPKTLDADTEVTPLSPTDRFRDLARSRPERPKVGFWRNLAAIGAGFGAGYTNAGGRVRPVDVGEVMDGIKYGGYNRKVADWQNKTNDAYLDSQAFEKGRTTDADVAYKAAETADAQSRARFNDRRTGTTVAQPTTFQQKVKTWTDPVEDGGMGKKVTDPGFQGFVGAAAQAEGYHVYNSSNGPMLVDPKTGTAKMVTDENGAAIAPPEQYHAKEESSRAELWLRRSLGEETGAKDIDSHDAKYAKQVYEGLKPPSTAGAGVAATNDRFERGMSARIEDDKNDAILKAQDKWLKGIQARKFLTRPATKGDASPEDWETLRGEMQRIQDAYEGNLKAGKFDLKEHGTYEPGWPNKGKFKMVPQSQELPPGPPSPKPVPTAAPKAKPAAALNNVDPSIVAYANQYFGGDVNAATQAIQQQRNTA